MVYYTPITYTVTVMVRIWHVETLAAHHVCTIASWVQSVESIMHLWNHIATTIWVMHGQVTNSYVIQIFDQRSMHVVKACKQTHWTSCCSRRRSNGRATTSRRGRTGGCILRFNLAHLLGVWSPMKFPAITLEMAVAAAVKTLIIRSYSSLRWLGWFPFTLFILPFTFSFGVILPFVFSFSLTLLFPFLNTIYLH